MNSITYIFAVIITVNILTIVEMVFYRQGKEKGDVIRPWLFPVTVLFYVCMNVSAVIEYVMYQPAKNLLCISLGCLALLLRFVLKYFSARTLGPYWSVHIEIRDNHRLIDSGLYRYIRHPGYLSTVFEIITIPLLAQAYYTLLWVCAGYSILLTVRIMLEEKEMGRKFGQEYEKYREHTHAVIPGRTIFRMPKRRQNMTA